MSKITLTIALSLLSSAFGMPMDRGCDSCSPIVHVKTDTSASVCRISGVLYDDPRTTLHDLERGVARPPSHVHPDLFRQLLQSCCDARSDEGHPRIGVELPNGIRRPGVHPQTSADTPAVVDGLHDLPAHPPSPSSAVSLDEASPGALPSAKHIKIDNSLPSNVGAKNSDVASSLPEKLPVDNLVSPPAKAPSGHAKAAKPSSNSAVATTSSPSPPTSTSSSTTVSSTLPASSQSSTSSPFTATSTSAAVTESAAEPKNSSAPSPNDVKVVPSPLDRLRGQAKVPKPHVPAAPHLHAPTSAIPDAPPGLPLASPSGLPARVHAATPSPAGLHCRTLGGMADQPHDLDLDLYICGHAAASVSETIMGHVSAKATKAVA